MARSVRGYIWLMSPSQGPGVEPCGLGSLYSGEPASPPLSVPPYTGLALSLSNN